MVFAIGNASRGDDALGPLLAERLEALDLPGLHLVSEFQLQVEHALEIAGAGLVLFIDAAQGQANELRFTEIRAQAGRAAFSHALAPAAVLAVFEQVEGVAAPPAFVLGVAGDRFELGAPLSARAAQAGEAAAALLRRLLAEPAAARWRACLTVR